nr:universal stress protein [Kocuria sp. CNJ-770]
MTDHPSPEREERRDTSLGEEAVRRRSPAAGGQGRALDATGEVVVGVDGSEQSLGALRWAAREARRRGLPVRLVTAYSMPVFSGSGFDTGYATVDEAALTQGVEELLNHAADQVRPVGVELRATVETGDPSGALLELSRTAELMVLGSRGRGGLLGRLLGTVSTAVPAHAKCPTGWCPCPGPRSTWARRSSPPTGPSWTAWSSARTAPRRPGRRCSTPRRRPACSGSP